MGKVIPAANAAQAERWNGASGLYWIKHRERHLAEHRYLTPHLFHGAAIVPGERVLDVGCGCGHTTIMAAQIARDPAQGETDFQPPCLNESSWDGSAVGLDLSAPMLIVARHLAAQASTVNAGFVRGDAQVCPLCGNSFDVMISNFGVMFFDDAYAAFASLAAAVRPHGRLAFLCWQDDTQNEVFAIPLRAFAVHVQMPGPSASDLFVDPRQITELLSRTGWENIQVAPVMERAWMGSDVDDVITYIRSMPMIRNLTASLNDSMLSERVLAAIAEQYGARQFDNGIWVRAAAWLVTARRALHSKVALYE